MTRAERRTRRGLTLWVVELSASIRVLGRGRLEDYGELDAQSERCVILARTPVEAERVAMARVAAFWAEQGRQ